MTYLMWKRGKGFRVGTSRTYTDGRDESLPGPAFRMNQEHADAAWVLSTHTSEAEARAEEVLVSVGHGLPTLPFVARRYGGHEGRSLVASQELLDRIFSELDTEIAGRDLIDSQGLSFDHPHFTAATTSAGKRVRRRLTVALCGDSRAGRPQHRIALFGYDDDGRAALEGLGLSIRPVRRGSSGWRHESSFADFSRLIERVEDIENALDVSVRFTARLCTQSGRTEKDRHSLPFVPASAVREGMVLVDEHGIYDLVEKVERVRIDRPVYDLDVERTHNFIANGLVTHNSIYAFRGADIRNILEFERDFPGTRVIALEQNYRSTNTILARRERASSEQPRAQGEEPLVGARRGRARCASIEVEDEHAEARFVAAEIAALVEEGYSAGEIAVFYRTNAQRACSRTCSSARASPTR